MEVHPEGKSEKKENALSNSAFLDKDEDKDNYVFIDEKYKKYFDNISDIFENKIEYVLNKHFKKNDPTNRNKLLCLNLCVLWQKKFLLLLSKTLNEYEAFKNKNNLNNEKEVDNEKEASEKKKDTMLKEKNAKGENKITDTTNAPTETANNESVIASTETTIATSLATEKDLKSFIKNVKIIDNKNIEVVYDISDLNDSRPSAELSTEEIYYLLVESKKSENEYKKKIFIFLQYLPLIIQSMETKNYLEKKNLEEKLLFTEFNNMNNFQHDGQNEHDNHLNQQNIDMENPNHNNNSNIQNINNVTAVDNYGMAVENAQNNPVSGNDNANNEFHLSETEITNKLNAIVNFNFSLSENLEKLFKNELSNNNNKNNMDDNNTTNNNNTDANAKNKNKFSYKSPLNNTENYNIMFSSNANCQNEDGNNPKKNLVLPLSRINDLSVINNISTKSNNITYEDVNENENEYLFYIYKNNMDKTNLYGLDILTNLNNKVLCKINHIYSLVQFYTMLAKDIFDEM